MFSYIWHTIFFDPIYNILVFFIDLFPRGDVGLAIIATIVLVKIILFPLSMRAIKTQRLMKEIQPKLKEVKEEFKEDKEAQAKELMKVYADAGMNPFASIFLMLLQIPIFIALYFAATTGGGIAFPEINTDLLYSFVTNPQQTSMLLFGSLDITGRSIALSIGAGIAQFCYMQLSIPKLKEKKADAAPDMKEDFMRNMQLQMKYVMPLFIVVICFTTNAVIALYFFVSNLTALAQELLLRKHRKAN